jgi:transcriptional regulator with XRE-family HTH domain
MRPSGDKRLLESLATVLKQRRNELLLTQEDLSVRCAVDRPYLTLIESGRKQPSLSVLYKLAKGLDLSFGDFADLIERRYLSGLAFTGE